MLKDRLRRKQPRAAEEFPAPPDELRFRVIGDRDLGNFLEGGKDTIADISAALAAVDKDLHSLRTILDFGCGCGRTLRAFAPEARRHDLYGSDFDAEAIAWCQENLPFARCDVNTPLPPLRYRSNQFDLIYALSVFTHLDETYQFQWLRELKRVLKPRGILLLTVHGQHYIDTLPREQAAEVQRDGFLFLKADHRKGIFPDWYQNAFHTEAYVRKQFGADFDILGHLPQGLGGRQDIVVLQNRRKWARRKKPTRLAPVAPPPPPAQPGAAAVPPEQGTQPVGAEPSRGVYTAPRTVTRIEDCYFYHTMDIPGHGQVNGQWDLRGVESQYLGGVDFTGKRVLEIGAASGFLTFYMERQGAEVVAYDLSENHSWDVVPFAGLDHVQADTHRKEHLRQIDNGFWFNHSAHHSRARMVNGTVYTIPEAIGAVDIATFGSVLLHLRDPFVALQTALRLVTDTAIVTDVFPWRDVQNVSGLIDMPVQIGEAGRPLAFTGEPVMTFLPQHWDHLYADTWWHLSPAVIQRFLGVLGFEKTEVTYHYAMGGGHNTLLYTVVGQRTKQP